MERDGGSPRQAEQAITVTLKAPATETVPSHDHFMLVCLKSLIVTVGPRAASFSLDSNWS